MVRLPVLGRLVSGPVTGSVVGRPVKSLTRRLSGELSGLSSVGSIPLGRNGTLDGTLNSGVSSNESGGLLGVVGLDLIRVSVEEQVGEDGPSLSVDGSSETEDLSAEEVPDETDRVSRLVVARDGNVNKLQRSVNVTKGDNGNVNVSSLPDSLVVDSGVGHDDQSRLFERTSDVVGERTGSKSSSNGLGAGESSVLEDGSVSVRSGTDDTDVVGVLDGGQDSGGQGDLGHGLADLDDVDTVRSLLVDVVLHGNIGVLGTEVSSSGDQQLNVVGSRSQNVGVFVGFGHFERRINSFLRVVVE